MALIAQKYDLALPKPTSKWLYEPASSSCCWRSRLRRITVLYAMIVEARPDTASGGVSSAYLQRDTTCVLLIVFTMIIIIYYIACFTISHYSGYQTKSIVYKTLNVNTTYSTRNRATGQIFQFSYRYEYDRTATIEKVDVYSWSLLLK